MQLSAAALSTAAKAKGFRVWWTRCYEERESPPHWPWIQILRSFSETPEPAQAKKQAGDCARYLGNVVGDFFGAPGQDHSPDQSSPQVIRFLFFDSFTGFLRTVSTHEPLLLIIDDLHRADSSSLHLLEYISRELDSSRIMILCAYRNTKMTKKLAFTHGELVRSNRFSLLDLQPFTREEMRAFVLRTIGIGLDPQTVSYLHARTEGIPLYLREITDDMAANPSIYAKAFQDETVHLRIPPTLNLAIAQRLGALSKPCIQTMILGAIIGREFSLSMLSNIADGAAEIAEGTIQEALEGGIIEEAGNGINTYRFAHVLIQEVLEGEASSLERAGIHKKIGFMLEKEYGEQADRNAEELAHHFYFYVLTAGELMRIGPR